MFQSPYRRGADDGFIFGLYLTAMFLASIFSGAVPLLSLVSLALMAGVPGVIYMFMKRYDRRTGMTASFPMFWMQGVMIFFCGMLIAGTVLVVYMKWLSPDFVLRQLQAVAAMKGSTPGSVMDEAASVASSMIENNFIPTPIAIVTELIMLAIVTGSILSIILGAILTLRRRATRPLSPQK